MLRLWPDKITRRARKLLRDDRPEGWMMAVCGCGSLHGGGGRCVHSNRKRSLDYWRYIAASSVSENKEEQA